MSDIAVFYPTGFDLVYISYGKKRHITFLGLLYALLEEQNSSAFKISWSSPNARDAPKDTARVGAKSRKSNSRTLADVGPNSVHGRCQKKLELFGVLEA